MIRVAINGFGRIGRLVFRVASEREDIEIVAVNDLIEPDHLLYLLKYDSVHGNFKKNTELQGHSLFVDGKETKIYSEKDPANLPWKELEVDYVIESTGIFNNREALEKHIQAGCKRVILSAPAKGGEVPTYVMGVNNKSYDRQTDFVISNASCTTNCLAPVVKVLLDNFGIDEGLMTTIHALTSSQPAVDGPSKKDWRGGRSALLNIIPSSTGAAKAVALCLPEIKGKLTGMAFRVPVGDVSCVDLTVKLSQKTSYQEICKVMKHVSENEMRGILGYTDDAVVSSDFISSTYSSIFDEGAGMELNDQFFKLISWYDNEMGYSARVIDLVEYIYNQE